MFGLFWLISQARVVLGPHYPRPEQEIRVQRPWLPHLKCTAHVSPQEARAPGGEATGPRFQKETHQTRLPNCGEEKTLKIEGETMMSVLSLVFSLKSCDTQRAGVTGRGHSEVSSSLTTVASPSLTCQPLGQRELLPKRSHPARVRGLFPRENEASGSLARAPQYPRGTYLLPK